MGSENEEQLELEAEHVFLLMKKEYRISRNTRAEWYFNHLNHTVFIPKADKVEHFKGEIEIVSAVPQEPPIEWDWDTSHLYQYVIAPSTVVTFLSHAYRLAFCLDLSPSVATVDCIEVTTLLDELLVSIKHCIQGLARPFIVPGSQLLFCPKIYITVIAHTPFLVSKGQQVLVAGWLLQQNNANSLIEIIQQKLREIEARLTYYTNLLEEQRDAQLADAERIVGGLFESMSDKTASIPFSSVTMTSPEVSFVSMLRYGMLALELLPEKSSAGIIVFTDGIIGATDSGMLEVLLSQLRHNTISCSFVQIGSRSCHPASSEGFLPDSDLLDFLAAATFGVCIDGAPEVDFSYEYRMNIYHQHFLTWGFHKSLLCSNQTVRESKKWPISNRCFEANYIHRIQKKENEYTVNCSLNGVLSSRLKEGFTIKEIVLDDEAVEVRLALPWRSGIQVEYIIRDQWPVNQPVVRCEVNVQGPYDFLHDVTCRKIQSFQSRYRQLVVQSYWAFLKNLVETDQLLAHLHSFSSNPAVYTVPEAIKSGVPLYYLPPNENSLVNTSNDVYPQFETFWRPICLLDLGSWQRWLHCHRIGIILQHDRQLPKHLHLPSANGRYIGIQCRQASAALHAALRDFTSFVLLENHSYIGLICTDSEKPVSFYLVRLTHKPPCVLIRIAFLGGTAGSIRQKVISELKHVIRSLGFPPRVLPQEYSNLQTTIPCCKVLHKPAEKILLRYEKVPIDFLQAAPHDSVIGTYQNNSSIRRQPSTPTPAVFKSPATQWSTLSHYLYHKRWIWSIQGSSGLLLNLHSVARILSIITKMRLQEGFSFAHSAAGIFTFLLEVEMKGLNNQPTPYQSEEDASGNCACVVQYVLFPPHPVGSHGIKEGLSDDEATEESDVQDNSDVQLEIVTECWVEPQAGVVSTAPNERRFFEGLDYTSLADSVRFFVAYHQMMEFFKNYVIDAQILS